MGRIYALASTVIGIKKLRATFPEAIYKNYTIYYSNNHSEVNNHKNKNMRKIERDKTSLLLLFIHEETLHLLQVKPVGLVLKLTTKADA